LEGWKDIGTEEEDEEALDLDVGRILALIPYKERNNNWII
jgi:hypothetical protein